MLLLLALACKDGPLSDDTAAPAADTLRVVTWNIQSLGEPDSEEYGDALTVLSWIDADVILLNEIDGYEDDQLETFAQALGHQVVSESNNDFGALHNAALTRLELASSTVYDGETLSGDSGARDLTRQIPELRVLGPQTGETVTFLGVHFKSGFDEDDAFRRNVDAERAGQAARLGGSRVVVMGDFNEQVSDVPGSPASWSSLPSGLPSSYSLGDDLSDQLSDQGLRNDPFAPLTDAGLRLVQAAQIDGDLGTRPSSGRRIDYIYASDAVEPQAAMVYSCLLEGTADAPIAFEGDSPGRGACEDASDHLPVIAELRIIAD
ncbi:MAG: endonuclease/exonuclease/phosphatase family protein [Myxococcota bacterium]|nr:endonuclease/exonuclease/phosphatase family protein [Myxococcota bacterium]